MYNEKVMEIFKNPHNVGELKDANGIGQVGNVACGDIMKIYLKINDNKVIEDAKFKTFGCAAAIVSSSIATDMIKGMTIDEALKLDNDKIIEQVGGFPTNKIHCSILAKEAIEEAVKDYHKRQVREAKKVAKLLAEQKETKKVSAVKEDAKTDEKQEKLNKDKQKTIVTETKNNSNGIDAKNLLNSLKFAKSKKQQTPEVENKETTQETVKVDPAKEEKSKKELKKEAAAKKKEELQKAKNAKKMEKNFKNLNERLNKLKK